MSFQELVHVTPIRDAFVTPIRVCSLVICFTLKHSSIGQVREKKVHDECVEPIFLTH